MNFETLELINEQSTKSVVYAESVISRMHIGYFNWDVKFFIREEHRNGLKLIIFVWP